MLLLATFVAAGRAAAGRAVRSAEPRALDFVPALWFAALIGALAGEALFGGSPLVTLFWLTLGIAAYRRPAKTP